LPSKQGLTCDHRFGKRFSGTQRGEVPTKPKLSVAGEKRFLISPTNTFTEDFRPIIKALKAGGVTASLNEGSKAPN
jgi:hypothetical protein